MQELPTSDGESSSAQSRELEPGKTLTRFVVWSEANTAECEPEDREWVQECLKSLGFLSLDELNGCSLTKAADHCDSID